MLHHLASFRAISRCLGTLGTRGEVGGQPVEGFPPKAGTFCVVKLGGIVALPGAGQRRVTGGVVTVVNLHVVGQFRLGGEGSAVKANSGDIEFLVLSAQRCQGNLLGCVGWLRLARQDCRQHAIELNQPLGLADPLRGRIRPAGNTGT